jgi:glyoxylase-like metal-dependent hydrolase (beta-lactamase superfamily II)
MHEPGSLDQLQRALDQVNLRLEDVRLVVCTHAHTDHWGQAAPICDAAGCELWLHPNHEHATRTAADPAAALEQRLEIGRQSGVPEATLARCAERFSQQTPSGIARVIEPDRPLVDGAQIATDLGTWTAYETPGHAPSHVCLYQPERRLLISGDHVLGRISLYYDYGWTPDPVGEFLNSLDVVDRLDARLGLSGHGRPFVDVAGHIQGTRRLVQRRLDALIRAMNNGMTALELAPAVHAQELSDQNAARLLQETLCYLRHLEVEGVVAREPSVDAPRWVRSRRLPGPADRGASRGSDAQRQP